MTREEAIEQIKWYFEEDDGMSAEDVTKEAVYMAIEALSQPIVCKDYCIDDDHIYCSPKVADRVVEALSDELTVQTPQTYGKSINPSNAEVVEDLISRADAVETVCRTRCGDKAKGCPAHSCLVIEEFDALPSADAVSREVYDKRTQADEEIIDSYRQEFQKALQTDSEEAVLNKMLEEEMIVLPQDYVKVVRCKDCRYGEKRIEDYRCWMLDEDWDIRFSPKHFCSYGQRREE